MRLKTFGIALCMGLGTVLSFAQKAPSDLLFTINNTPYYAEDFKRVYDKNIALIAEEDRDLAAYLELYMDYKLKVQYAKELGLDTLPRYKSELSTHQKQLEARFLTNETINDALIEEAYQRSLKHIRASHILVLLDAYAAPSDTLLAYNKAMNIRKELLAGASFSEKAKQYSDDPSAQNNGGDIGFFSVFQMVYPFETGAYNTPLDSISKPVRSSFGYHLIKVNEIRETRGDISIAHIMLLKPQDGDAAEEKRIEDSIQELYERLQTGEDFESLSKHYSDDRLNRAQGGVIPRFSSGSLQNPVLEDAAYALQNPNDLSIPIETDHAWHIVRLIEKYPLPNFETIEPTLVAKVKRDSRSRKINEALVEELKSQFTIEEQAKTKASLSNYINQDILTNTWKAPQMSAFKNAILLKINGDLTLRLSDLFDYVKGNQLLVRGFKDEKRAVAKLYDSFVETELKNYYTDNLRNLNPEYDALLTEYEDGILLFDLMQQEVWHKAKTDTLGYTAYYEAHRQNYFNTEKARVLCFEVSDKKQAQKVEKLLNQGKSKKAVLDTFQTKAIQFWEVDEKLVETSTLPKEVGSLKEGGVYVVTAAAPLAYQVIQVQSIQEAGIPPLESIQGKVVSDYQAYFEKQWLDALRNRADIKRYDAVFSKL